MLPPISTTRRQSTGRVCLLAAVGWVTASSRLTLWARCPIMWVVKYKPMAVQSNQISGEEEVDLENYENLFRCGEPP